MKYFLSSLLLVLAFSACTKLDDNGNDGAQNQSSLVPTGWVLTVVDSLPEGNDVGDFNKILIDKNQGIHLVYNVEDSQGISLKYTVHG